MPLLVCMWTVFAERPGAADEAFGDTLATSCFTSGCPGRCVNKPTCAMYDKACVGNHTATRNTRHSEQHLLVFFVNVDLSPTRAVGRWVVDAFFLRVH